MKNHQFDNLEAAQQELNHLRQMIREASDLEDLNELHHYVGESEAEAAVMDANNRRLDALEKRCAWDKQECLCSADEHRARAEWNAVMERQKAIEAKYC